MKRIGWFLIVAAIALSLSGCCCLSSSSQTVRMAQKIGAGAVQRQTRQVELEGADRVKVNLDLGGGELYMERGDVQLLTGEFAYNLDGLEPVIEYTLQGTQAILDIHPTSDKIDWGWANPELRNEWRLKLTDRVPLEIAASVGNSSGDLQLGGLRIAGLDLEAGATDMRISFDEPNPELLRSFAIRSGAAKLELGNLGNANMQTLDFDGGLGTYTFDFSGKWQQSASVQIKAGASQVTLRVPRDIGVRICPGDLRGSYDGLKKQDDCYVNQWYGQSDIELQIDLDLGLGKLIVR